MTNTTWRRYGSRKKNGNGDSGSYSRTARFNICAPFYVSILDTIEKITSAHDKVVDTENRIKILFSLKPLQILTIVKQIILGKAGDDDRGGGVPNFRRGGPRIFKINPYIDAALKTAICWLLS